jgi:glycosyltransferase involved in cell wall biosynthesis
VEIRPKDPRLAAFEGSPFLLCVGTIEVRKNHVRLVKAYKALVDKHGAASLPKLVIVGREGWKIGPYKRFMEETGAVNGQIVTLGGLSDQDLVWLYRQSLFSIFISLAEGWGLPAGESAWFGKVCLTSNCSSMPEVLGEFGEYCDPRDEASIAAALERLIFDKTAFQDAQRKILAMPLRSWRDVADNILSLVNQITRKAASL